MATRSPLAVASLVIGLCIAATCPATCSAAMVEFHRRATVTSGLVRLGDIATVYDSDPKNAEKLRAIALAPAPAGERGLRLTVDDVRERLQAKGVSISSIEFSGSSEVEVSGEAAVRTSRTSAVAVTELQRNRVSDLLQKSIQRHLSKQWADASGHRAVFELRDEQTLEFSQAATTRLDIAGGREPWVGEQSFVVTYQQREGGFRQVPFSCRIEPLPRVLVPKRALARGQTILADDLEWKQVAALPVNKPTPRSLEELVGSETRRPLQAGEPVALADVRLQLLVRRGDLVTLTCRRGAVRVSLDGKALGEGSRGDVITVATLDGRSRLSARITGFHEVELVASQGTASNGSASGSSASGSSGNSTERSAPPAESPENGMPAAVTPTPVSRVLSKGG